MKINFKEEIKPDEKVTPKDVFNKLLKLRKIESVDEFMKPLSPLKISLKDFGYEKKFGRIIPLLQSIKEKKGKIVVYTDYDADGITGGAILWETLHLLGFDVMPYVPHRQTEGYGFSKIGIDKVKEEYNPDLIISVDHGITAVEQISYAKKLGIKVIVTDHHHKQTEIPKDAEAIFHIPQLSGSGVSYFFAKEVYDHFQRVETRLIASLQRLERYFETDYLTLASIGTIADLVPLVGPSRSVVKYGLDCCSKVKRHGFRAILEEAKIENKVITPYEVGFIIAPRINAVGRLEHAIDALRLLCTTDLQRATSLASQIGEQNTSRQDLVKQSVEEAKAMMSKLKEIPKLIILHSKKWHEGIIGLIASNLLEEYYRPVIIMTQSDGHLKGSARSITTFHITKFFEELSDLFESFGGHAQAAGFTLSEKNLEKFIKKATKKSADLIKDADLIRTMEVDMKVPVYLQTMTLARNLEKLAPFGVGHAKPSFVSHVELVSSSIFGKNKDHLKIMVKDLNKSSFPFELIAFGKADLFTQLSRGQQLTVAYRLDINSWNGKETLRGMILDIDHK